MTPELEQPPQSGQLAQPEDSTPPSGPPGPSGPPVKEMRRSGIPRTLIEIVVIVSAAIVIALLVQAFLVKPFTIHQVSMRPTLEEGDRILLNRLSFRLHTPARGDVIVFHSPINPSEDLVKRIVGVAGDTIEVKGGKLYRNGVAQDEPYILEQRIAEDYAQKEVPVGEVFVMGDNRNNSGDSRFFGPIPISTIIGKAFAVYWPVGHWKSL